MRPIRYLQAATVVFSLIHPAWAADKFGSCVAAEAQAPAQQKMASLALLLRFAGKRARIPPQVARPLGLGWHLVSTESIGVKENRTKLVAAVPTDKRSDCFFFARVRTKYDRRIWLADDSGKLLHTISIHHGVQRTVANKYYKAGFKHTEAFFLFRAITYRAPRTLDGSPLYPKLK